MTPIAPAVPAASHLPPAALALLRDILVLQDRGLDSAAIARAIIARELRGKGWTHDAIARALHCRESLVTEVLEVPS